MHYRKGRFALPTIRIDDDVFAELQKRATPFVDTPNDVLRRLFSLDGGRLPSSGSPTVQTKRRRAGRLQYQLNGEWIGTREFLTRLERSNHPAVHKHGQSFETVLRGSGNGLSNLAKDIAKEFGIPRREADA